MEILGKFGPAGYTWAHPNQSRSLFMLPILIHCFQRFDDRRILQSDWTRSFCHVTCEPEFSHIWGLHRKIEKCNIFHFRLIPVMTTIYEKQEKIHFGFFLPILGKTKTSLENLFLPLIFSFQNSITVQNLRETSEQNPIKVGCTCRDEPTQ